MRAFVIQPRLPPPAFSQSIIYYLADSYLTAWHTWGDCVGSDMADNLGLCGQTGWKGRKNGREEQIHVGREEQCNLWVDVGRGGGEGGRKEEGLDRHGDMGCYLGGKDTFICLKIFVYSQHIFSSGEAEGRFVPSHSHHAPHTHTWQVDHLDYLVYRTGRHPHCTHTEGRREQA